MQTMNAIIGAGRWFCPFVLGCMILALWYSSIFTGVMPVTHSAVVSQLQRFIEGIDQAPKPMGSNEIEDQLNDPLATALLRKGILPSNVDELVGALNRSGGTTDDQKSYFISESGKIEDGQGTGTLSRKFRMVITWPKNNPTVLISSPAGDRQGFIEMQSWDDKKKAINFYRRTSTGQWLWKGDGGNAFAAGSRGKGCFQCHINGVPVMKELRRPWNNWHSQIANIPREAIPDDEIRRSKFFVIKSNAEELENTVKGWISKATSFRIAGLMRGLAITDAPFLLRSLFETTTINLASSPDRSQQQTPSVHLPQTFFLNFDVFGLPELLSDKVPTGFDPQVKRQFYTATLNGFDFRLEDKKGGNFMLKGDTFFAFFVPVASEEDTRIIQQLIAQNIITSHFALSVLMVDFPNPIFSPARKQLLQYVPNIGRITRGRSDLSERTAQAILEVAKRPSLDSPEKQFAANWSMKPEQLLNQSRQHISQYLNAVIQRLGSQGAMDDYTRLAESRRRQFAATFKQLNEFPLLLPKTNIPAEARLRMNADGTVSPQT